MMSYLLTSWVLVFFVMCADIAFALIYKDTMGEWEANPIVLELYNWGGILPPICFRFLTLIFGFVVIMKSNESFRYHATNFVLGVHILLACYLFYSVHVM